MASHPREAAVNAGGQAARARTTFPSRSSARSTTSIDGPKEKRACPRKREARPRLRLPGLMSKNSPGTQITFNGYGVPDYGGSVVVRAGHAVKTVTVNATTGAASVQ